MGDEMTIAEASIKALLDLQAADERIRLDRFLDTLDAVHDPIAEEALRVIKSQAKRIEELESLRPSFERRGGQRMADAINFLVRRGILDARSRAADASLDWADPDFKRMDEIESLQAQNAELKEENGTLREALASIGEKT